MGMIEIIHVVSVEEKMKNEITLVVIEFSETMITTDDSMEIRSLRNYCMCIKLWINIESK